MAVVGIIGDTHLPYELEGYLEFCVDTFAAYGCDTIVHIGDIVDNHSVSFHDKEPMIRDVHGEYLSICEHLQPWYKEFPYLTLIQGNHDRLPARQLTKIGLAPQIYLRPIRDVYSMPEGWMIEDDIVIDDVLYHHGESALGVNGFRKDAESRMMSTVTGHNHSNAGISATATSQELVFGMAVGCGVNNKHLAFAYGRHFPRKPVISCGVVYNGEPIVEFMNLGRRIKRI